MLYNFFDFLLVSSEHLSTSLQPVVQKDELNLLQSTLLNQFEDYPSDPYLFKNTILSQSIIRALIEIGHCQPGIDKNKFVFPRNESGQSFLPNWYEIKQNQVFLQKKLISLYSKK